RAGGGGGRADLRELVPGRGAGRPPPHGPCDDDGGGRRRESGCALPVSSPLAGPRAGVRSPIATCDSIDDVLPLEDVRVLVVVEQFGAGPRATLHLGLRPA